MGLGFERVRSTEIGLACWQEPKIRLQTGLVGPGSLELRIMFINFKNKAISKLRIVIAGRREIGSQRFLIGVPFGYRIFERYKFQIIIISP